MKRIAWLDLETTGLVAGKDAILEIACVITDATRGAALAEVARLHVVTCAARSYSFHLLPVAVQNMHHANGLWMESLRSSTEVSRAIATLDEFLALHGGRDVPLGGNTPSFDRGFIAAAGLDVEQRLNHRHVDASALTLLAEMCWPDVHRGRPGAGAAAHRATADVEHSIATVHYYAARLGPVALEAAA